MSGPQYREGQREVERQQKEQRQAVVLAAEVTVRRGGGGGECEREGKGRGKGIRGELVVTLCWARAIRARQQHAPWHCHDLALHPARTPQNCARGLQHPLQRQAVAVRMLCMLFCQK